MEGEGQGSGNEETPYTVVVQIPNPYGDSSDPIYVFGSSNHQGSDQSGRMTHQIYQTVNSVESESVIYVQGEADEVLNDESGDAEQDGENDGTVEEEAEGMTIMQANTPIRIIAHPHAKSFVWQHFGFVPIGDSDTPDRRRVLCRLCLRELPYCGNTTNLQYHLQRYHRDVMPEGLRELRPTPRTARRASRLPDPIGDPGQLIIVEASPEARRRGNYARRGPAQGSSTGASPTSVGDGDMPAPSSTSNSSSNNNASQQNNWHWHSSRKQQLTGHITRSLVTDCLPIGTIEGPGFQNLIKLLDPNFEFQSASQFRTQLIPSLQQEERKRIMSALHGVEYCSLTLDVWKSREADFNYVGVACHFVNNDWVVDSRYLTTLELTNGQDSDDLTRRLQKLMSEWKLAIRWAVTGSTAPEHSDLPLGFIHNALTAVNLPDVACLASALQHAASKAMQVPAVETAIKRVRALISHIQRTPDLRIKVHDRLVAQNLLPLPSGLPKSASWFQVYTVLMRLQAGREIIQTIFSESREDSSSMLPTTKEIITLDSLQAVFKPLDEAAETLSGDPYPSVSLILPLLWKLTQVTLSESADDMPILADLKSLARSALRSSYDREETQQLLRMAMYLDPRLKRLPFFSKEEKVSVQQMLRKELTKIIKKQGGGSSAASQTYRGAQAPAGKKPKLATMLADIFDVPNNSGMDDEEANGKDSMSNGASQSASLSLPENIAQSELQCYENEEAVSLEEPQPLRWWKAREGQYKFLSKLARRILCMAATSIPMRRLLTVEGQAWTDRRAVLPAEDIDVIFLSHNFGGGSGTLSSTASTI